MSGHPDVDDGDQVQDHEIQYEQQGELECDRLCPEAAGLLEDEETETRHQDREAEHDSCFHESLEHFRKEEADYEVERPVDIITEGNRRPDHEIQHNCNHIEVYMETQL